MNVPKLRFKDDKGCEFSEWQNKFIGTVAEVTTGDKDTQNKINDGIYPFFVRSQTVEKINSYSFDGEAILTSGDGVGVGKNFHYINGKFDFHQRVYCLHSFKNEINGKFVFHYFSEKFNRRVMQLSAKNSVDSVRRSMITDMPICTPSFAEQTKIANFLSEIDEKIAQFTQKRELLTQYKKGMMQKIFSQEIRFKEFNDSWASQPIGEILTIGSGRDYKHLKAGRVPVFGTGGLMTTVDGFLHDGETVCIGRKGTIDKPMYFNGKLWTVDTLFYTHSFKNIIPKFVFYLFQRVNWQEHNEASGVPSLSKSTIEKIVLSFPSLLEQKKIANFLSAIDEKITTTESALDYAKRYKKSLLQQMFV